MGTISGFEGRFDRNEEIKPLLEELYELRQQADAEEWPVASEPIHDELSGAAQPTPTAAPAGGEVSVRLHHIALVSIGVFLSTWWFVHSLALSISQ